jgi:ubiquinone/menaquinone biosynthesis C-methylase UbiE
MMQISTLKDEGRRSFDGLASEYYDPMAHPTCENFRAASRLLIQEWLSDRTPGPTVEVGCGASLLAEVLTERHQSLASITLSDLSPLMLAHSNGYEKMGAKLVLASSDDLPLPTGSQESLVSSLGDPYNDQEFWKEAARVLKVGGQVFFTTPSFEWSKSFRALLPPTLRSKAEFVTAAGHKIWIPSIIISEEAQKPLMERAGFRLVESRRVCLKSIPPPISRKLVFLGDNVPIVTGFFAERL